MDAQTNEGLSSQHKKVIELGNDEINMNQAISQLEVAFELGLAGLREYLNQLAPDDREKVLKTISDSIKNF